MAKSASNSIGLLMARKIGVQQLFTLMKQINSELKWISVHVKNSCNINIITSTKRCYKISVWETNQLDNRQAIVDFFKANDYLFEGGGSWHSMGRDDG